MKKTNRELLNMRSDHQYVDLTLYLSDIKILYNTCMDVLDECPEMISYKQIAKKLKLVINNTKLIPNDLIMPREDYNTFEFEDDIYGDDDIHTLASASEPYHSEQIEDDLPF